MEDDRTFERRRESRIERMAAGVAGAAQGIEEGLDTHGDAFTEAARQGGDVYDAARDEVRTQTSGSGIPRPGGGLGGSGGSGLTGTLSGSTAGSAGTGSTGTGRSPGITGDAGLGHGISPNPGAPSSGSGLGDSHSSPSRTFSGAATGYGGGREGYRSGTPSYGPSASGMSGSGGGYGAATASSSMPGGALDDALAEQDHFDRQAGILASDRGGSGIAGPGMDRMGSGSVGGGTGTRLVAKVEQGKRAVQQAARRTREGAQAIAESARRAQAAPAHVGNDLKEALNAWTAGMMAGLGLYVAAFSVGLAAFAVFSFAAAQGLNNAIGAPEGAFLLALIYAIVGGICVALARSARAKGRAKAEAKVEAAKEEVRQVTRPMRRALGKH